jgi:hypothetical protein
MSWPLPAVDVVGFWIGVFLTFCILSYLYKDNPFYKFAEHLFVGVSIGYIVCKQYYDVIRPNLLDHFKGDSWGELLYVIPIVLVLMLFIKAVSPRLTWVGRYPLAFVVALYAGIQINAYAGSDLAEQLKASTRPIVSEQVNVNEAPASDLATVPGLSPPVARKIVEHREKQGVTFRSLDELAGVPGLTPEQRQDIQDARGPIAGLDAQASLRSGDINWFEAISRFLLLIGLCASIIYFYFSIEQRGAVGRISRVGVLVLMLGFGAAFGYTVQGRLALAVGRAIDVLDFDKSPQHQAQVNGPIVAIVSIVIIVAGLIVWEIWSKRRPRRDEDGGEGGGGGGGEGGGSTGPDDELPQY